MRRAQGSQAHADGRVSGCGCVGCVLTTDGVLSTRVYKIHKHQAAHVRRVEVLVHDVPDEVGAGALVRASSTSLELGHRVDHHFHEWVSASS